MAEYHTRQKQALLDFLTRHASENYTIEEIIEAMQKEPEAEKQPGKSTTYRLITRLVEEGVVKRFLLQGHGRKFVYQIAGCDHCDSHLHLKCTGCGQLFHMDDEASELLLQEVLEANQFSVDEAETVLYGKCRECKKR